MGAKTSKPITLSRLNNLFKGRLVRIIDTEGGSISSRFETGICKMFHRTKSRADVELMNGNRYGFIPDTMSDDAVEGSIWKHGRDRRRVQLEPELERAHYELIQRENREILNLLKDYQPELPVWRTVLEKRLNKLCKLIS